MPTDYQSYYYNQGAHSPPTQFQRLYQFSIFYCTIGETAEPGYITCANSY